MTVRAADGRVIEGGSPRPAGRRTTQGTRDDLETVRQLAEAVLPAPRIASDGGAARPPDAKDVAGILALASARL